MIGLVFSFFFAVCLLLISLVILGALFETGAIWWVLGAIVLFFLWVFVQTERNNKEFEATSEARKTACIARIDRIALGFPDTPKNQATVRYYKDRC